MLVTESSFFKFMVYTEVDIAVSMVLPDAVVCLEIKEKTSKFFSTVLLPQMVAEWFVKIDYVPVISNSVEVNVNNDGIVIGEEMQAENLCNGSTTKSTDVISATATNGNSAGSNSSHQTYYTCCTGVSDKGTVITCSNIDCLMGTYHKSCVKPARKRFGPTWMCKSCADILKKTKKRNILLDNSENVGSTAKLSKRRNVKPFQSINSNL